MSDIDDCLVLAEPAVDRQGRGCQPRRDLLVGLSAANRTDDNSVLYCYQFIIVLGVSQHFLPPNPLKIILLSSQKK